MTDSCSVRPVMSRNSSTLSNVPESLQSGSATGNSLRQLVAEQLAAARRPARACIQLMLPRSVLISPLWLMNRIGWARSHEGNVFVENREWTIARWLV